MHIKDTILRTVLITALLLVSQISLLGQTTAQKKNEVVVRDLSGNQLDFAWAGGLNAPQFSEIDLNFDGILDLFIFDKEGHRVTTYLNGGQSGTVDYTYAPEYEDAFPDMVEFAILVDYNYDGKHDIFTHDGGGGMIVFKNTSSSGNLSFTRVTYPNLRTYWSPGSSANLYVSRIDIPAITDVDNDGDIDVLAFDNSAKSINFFENFAADSGSTEDFKFHRNTACWGNFSEDGLTNQVILNDPCPKSKSQGGNKHSGATLLAFDNDGDGDKDLLLGDFSYKSLIFMENGGSPGVANMVTQTTNFPSSKPVDLANFPAAFQIDVNNDGLKDLLIAPNSRSGGIVENKAGVWYYKNTGSISNPVFTFQKEDFFQESMIETGAGAFPVFFDFNRDGLKDLVVGNNGIYNGASNQISKLLLFKNVGNSNSPEFELYDNSMADLETISLNTTLGIPTYNVAPTFADLNADASQDMLVGDYNGMIHYFTNAPVNGESNFSLKLVDLLGIDVGQYAKPQLFDLDGDGLQDLIIGNAEGFLTYYHNEGTPALPDFVFKTDRLGNVNTRSPFSYHGYSQPQFVNADQDVYLLSGSERGFIYYYNNIRSNLNGSFNLVDSMYLGIDEGSTTHIAADDIDSDGLLEFVIGNYAGGLAYFETDYSVGIENRSENYNSSFELRLQNIDRDNVRVIINDGEPNLKAELNLYNVSGQLLLNQDFSGIYDLSTSDLNRGLYFISVKADGIILNEKYLKQP